MARWLVRRGRLTRFGLVRFRLARFRLTRFRLTRIAGQRMAQNRPEPGGQQANQQARPSFRGGQKFSIDHRRWPFRRLQENRHENQQQTHNQRLRNLAISAI